MWVTVGVFIKNMYVYVFTNITQIANIRLGAVMGLMAVSFFFVWQ